VPRDSDLWPTGSARHPSEPDDNRVENFRDGKPKGICSGAGGPNLFCIWVGFWDKDTRACDGINAP